MNPATTEKWNQRAWLLQAWNTKLTVPFHVLTDEAIDVARFALRYWEPAGGNDGQEVRPGLAAAARDASFSRETVSDIIELTEALQAAQTKYRLLVGSSKAAPVERAQFLLSELRATLEWCSGNERSTASSGQLEALAAAHAEAQSQDALAAALFDYTELAARSEAQLQRLGGFDVALIGEARSLAAALREHSARASGPEPSEATAQELRDRLATMLSERVARVRAAARFVFRHHPDLMKEAASTYARRRRALHKRKKRGAGGEQASPPSADG